MTQERFSGRLVTLLTMIGVAIGLGNVWRFPYMMGQYGGSAFLLLYVLFVLLFGIPALAAECALGRRSRSGTIGAFRLAFGRTGAWLGAALVIGVLIADSYYMVVVGNIVYTAAFSLTRGFSPDTASAYASGLELTAVQYACAIAVLLGGLWVIQAGLHRGIERTSRWFVPFFGAVVVYLVAHTLTLDGALDGLAVFMQPDFSKIGPRELFAALGQACFSLGLGGTFMLAYGSFLRDETRILPTALGTGLGDMSAALMAALFIVPGTLAFGIDLAGGPGLIFATLPELFASLPLGRLTGTLFLAALALMAFLSAVAALQVGLDALERVLPHTPRARLVAIIGAIEAVLMLPTAHWPALIAHLDLIFGSGMQTLGAALAVLGLTWGLGSSTVREEITADWSDGVARGFLIWLRFAVPAVLLGLLLLYVYDQL